MKKRHDSAVSISRFRLLLSALGTLGLLTLVACGPLGLESNPVDASPPEDASTGGDESPVAAIVDDQPITLEEVQEHMKDQFIEEFRRQPEDRQYELMENAVRDLVRRRVIDAEARKRGVTREELFEEITANVPEPTLEDVTNWYTKNKQRLRGAALEDIADQIKNHLANERRSRALKDFLDPKLEATSWKMVLSPPRKELEATRLVRGPAEAPVTLMVFSDYQCPYCIRAEPVLAEVLERYPDRVRLIHRHFPLDSLHPFARSAAEAAMCADEQGRFWDFHDAIFARKGRLEKGTFEEIARKLGLDMEAFGTCVEERRYKDYVEADSIAGQKAGVTGTPAFFVNGIALKGARTADELSRIIDSELARSGATSAGK